MCVYLSINSCQSPGRVALKVAAWKSTDQPVQETLGQELQMSTVSTWIVCVCVCMCARAHARILVRGRVMH